MPVQIEILSVAIQRLQDLNTPGFANLYGVAYEGKLLIVGVGYDPPSLTREYSSSLISVTAPSRKIPDWANPKDEVAYKAAMEALADKSSSSAKSEIDNYIGFVEPKDSETSLSTTTSYFDKHQLIYPSGIDHIGVMGIIKGTPMDFNDIKERVKDVHVTNTVPYFEKDLANDSLKIYYFFDGLLHPTDFRMVSVEEFKANFVYLRLLANMSVNLPVRAKPSKRSFKDINELAARIAEEMIFRIGKSDLYITKHNVFHGIHSSVGKVYDAATKVKDHITGLEVLNLHGMFPSTVRTEWGPTCYAPLVLDYANSVISKPVASIVSYDKHTHRFRIKVELPFDGLCLVHRERSINNIHSLLLDAAQRTLYLAEVHVHECAEDPLGVQVLQTYHFMPSELGHPVSLIYMSDEADHELIGVRYKIHESLNIPMERPLFTKGMSLQFVDAKEPLIPLLNVHVGLKSSLLKGKNRKTAVVYGNYEYHHYMQGLDDCGWGCAYRSLQTIFSWFKLQGYTKISPPSHEKIQKILVKIGDKNDDFVGSKMWIGSTEVSYVLEDYMRVACQLINISSGSEMSTMGPTLYEHFKEHGTPVMIGGGVLAHTILGVDYDEDTSEIRFLILDPHYTGEDVLSTIQQKGGVGWKGMDFWNPNAFYNMCCPQRPIYF